jgi:hypothetical protein
MSPVSAIGTLRIAIGVSSWLTPNLAGKAFGLDPAGNPQAAFLGRLFGVRDIALGAGALQTSGQAQQQWLRVGMMCDLADAAAAYLATRNGTLPKPAGILAGGTALAAAALSAQAMNAQPAATV